MAGSATETLIECRQFLVEEARLLDRWQLREWLELLTDDIEYVVPVREMREGSDEFSEDSFHFNEDSNTLATRVDRLDNDYAWAEMPRSQVRRFVSNVSIRAENESELEVESYLLFRRVRRTEDSLLTCNRCDTLRRTGGDLRLARREVYLDDTRLNNSSLPVFL